DIFVSASQVTAALESAGIAVLRNEARPIAWQGSTLWIVGIDDSLHGRPDLDKAFCEVRAGDPALALWHEPQFAAGTAARGAIAQLSGHTHGGQVRLPGIRPVWLPQHGRRFVTGLHNVMGMPVYTSRGVGVYRPPVRLNCPPEVTLISFEVEED
ncbi:MAG: metallophosphoesterase, partial [Thermomicrobiales bacterium]